MGFSPSHNFDNDSAFGYYYSPLELKVVFGRNTEAKEKK
jgi:hypothetical protein